LHSQRTLIRAHTFTDSHMLIHPQSTKLPYASFLHSYNSRSYAVAFITLAGQPWNLKRCSPQAITRLVQDTHVSRVPSAAGDQLTITSSAAAIPPPVQPI
jgi:hypothetical protein